MAIGEAKEIKMARAQVRARERAVWDDRDAAGQAARATDTAKQSETAEDPAKRQRSGQAQGVT